MKAGKTLTVAFAALGFASCFGLAACSSEGGAADDDVAGSSQTLVAEVANMDFEYTKRDMDASYDAASATKVLLDTDGTSVEGEGAAAEGSVVTVSAAGTYVLSGELSDGCIVVAALDDAKVQLVLDDASIHCENGPAIRVDSADKVFVTLAEGSRNVLSDGAVYQLAEDEDEPNAVLYSKADLTLNGSGSLEVTGSYAHAVNSKDDLVVTGGSYAVSSAEDALRGKDCVKIADGEFVVEAGGDGIKSSNDEDPTRGFVSIDGGSFSIDAGDDGVDAFSYFRVMDGGLDVTAADDAFHSDGDARLAGGELAVNAGDDAFHAEYTLTVDGATVDVAACYEGLEAQKVYVNDGDMHIVSADDGLNAAAPEVETAEAAADEEAVLPGDEGGVPALPEGSEPPTMPERGGAPDGGFGVDGLEPPAKPSGDAGGADAVSEPPEDMQDPGAARPSEGGRSFDEAQMPDGTQPSDAAGGARRPDKLEEPGAAADGMVERGTAGAMPGASEDCLIQINGGYLVVDAGGDGIDSNGSVEVNGGVVLVEGPASSADSALDYEISATVTGGTVLMVGQMGMAQGFSDGTQAFAMVQVSGEAGQSLAITDEAGEVMVSYTPKRSYQVAVASAPDMGDGEICNAVVGGAVQDANADGFADDGVVDGGNAVSFTASLEALNAGFGARPGEDFGARPGKDFGRAAKSPARGDLERGSRESASV